MGKHYTPSQRLSFERQQKRRKKIAKELGLGKKKCFVEKCKRMATGLFQTKPCCTPCFQRLVKETYKSKRKEVSS